MVGLTDAGLRYLERSRRILAHLADADQMADSERDEPLGRPVVSAPPVFGRLHVVPLVCAFMTRHPKITAELLLSDRMVNLVEGGVDLAVRICNLTDSSDNVCSVGVRRVLVASPRYLSSQGMPRSPDQLGNHRLIAFTSIGRQDRWSFSKGDTPHEVHVRP